MYAMQCSPSFSGDARICCEQGQRLKLCHGALTVDFRAGCSSCSMTNGFVTNAVLVERAVSCWHLHQIISQTTQYLDSWLSDLEVDGRHVPQCPIAADATAPIDVRTLSILCSFSVFDVKSCCSSLYTNRHML